jgi:trypsin
MFRSILVLGALLQNALSMPFDSIESIVGGLPTGSSDKYPMIVSMQNNKRHFCGGTLVDEHTVVSAAHCSGRQVSSNLTVVAHRFDLRKPLEEENAAVFSVSDILIHPSYNFSLGIRYDIAIWKVNLVSGDLARLRLNEVRFDDGSKSQTSQMLRTAGWGAIGWRQPGSPELLEVDVPVVSQEECKVAYSDLHEPSAICAGYPEGLKDSCNGDSGGPLFAYENQVFTLVGVVSYGEECAKPGFPGVYARITSVLDFIKENMGPK